MKNPHAVALGRKGGRVSSEAKKKSGALNMQKAREAKKAKQLNPEVSPENEAALLRRD